MRMGTTTGAAAARQHEWRSRAESVGRCAHGRGVNRDPVRARGKAADVGHEREPAVVRAEGDEPTPHATARRAAVARRSRRRFLAARRSIVARRARRPARRASDAASGAARAARRLVSISRNRHFASDVTAAIISDDRSMLASSRDAVRARRGRMPEPQLPGGERIFARRTPMSHMTPRKSSASSTSTSSGRTPPSARSRSRCATAGGASRSPSRCGRRSRRRTS